MLLAVSAIGGFALNASDGKIGTVTDLLFDDRSWNIRWMVVDTGSWLTGRKVLVHPSVIADVDLTERIVNVRLSRAQVKESPAIASDAPVSLQMQENLYGFYGWDPLWGGAGYFGGYPYPMSMPMAPRARYADTAVLEAEQIGMNFDDADPHLRSLSAVTGYHLLAVDGTIGHVENFLVDDVQWSIRYMIVDTRNWWPGRHVLLSPFAVKEISWSEGKFHLNVSRDKVKHSPVWAPEDIVDQAYEKHLHGYYGWPGYGW